MAVFMDDPSVLTKERLKSELLAHNVELPGGNPSRDVYVQLYVKTLSAQSQGTDAALDAFSSDEELPSPVVSRKSFSGRKSAAAQLDVTLLTDEALRDQLLVHGVHAGPIVASTRKLYEKKLQKLQDKGAVLSEPQKNHNSSREVELYSDQEEELAADPDPKPAPELDPVPEQKEGVRSRRNNISQRCSSSQHSTRPVERTAESTELTRRSNRLSYRMVSLEPLIFISSCNISPIKNPSQRNKMEKVQKVEKEEQVERVRTDPPLEEDPAVPELTFTGLIASCRQPIKGAAGRPVIFTSHSQSAHKEIQVSSSAFSSVGSAPSTTSTANPALFSVRSAPSSATSSVPKASTPSAHQAKARGGISWWKKLLFWAVLTGFLFLVYQAMETNSTAPFEEAQEL